MNNNGERKEKIIPDIITNYQQLESSIVEQLYMKRALHGTTIGTEREEVWSQVFEAILSLILRKMFPMRLISLFLMRLIRHTYFVTEELNLFR